MTDRADQTLTPGDDNIHLANFIKIRIELKVIKVTAPHSQFSAVLTAQGPISLAALQKAFPDRAVFGGRSTNAHED